MLWAGRLRKDSLEVRDVMEYFGEYVKDEEEAEELIEKAKGHIYSKRMSEIRRILMDKGFNVPFRVDYRRIENE